MTEEQGQITAYDPSMAAQVAQMFNDFDELWPGGFGGGIPYDERRVRDWLDKTSAIADLIAVDRDGAPVGYCGLYPHWRDEHAAYVTILGVVPRVKGQKYGKRLLLKAIETASRRGIRRVDLHTWSGNLNAVPLYKKVGLFWVPETSVYMQNYIPALAQSSLGQGWFAAHPDWYACFRRELAQAPDRQVDGAFELYTYVFEEGQDRLVGEVDRYGWGLCGVERALGGETLSVKTRLRAHEVLIGLPNEMTIAVDNHTGRDLGLALAVEPFKGLSWEKPFPLTLSVPDGTSASVSRSFVVDKSANARYDPHKASETIRTRVIFEGQTVDLVTGGKLQPAVRLTSGQSYQVVPLGTEAEVCLDLVNHARQALRGQVDLFVEGAAGSRQQFPFALEAEERSGIVIDVPPVVEPGLADVRDPVRVLHAVPSIEANGASAAMPAYRLSLVDDAPEWVAVVEADDGKSVWLLTDALDIHAELEGGRVHVTRRTLPGVRWGIRFQAGPPFGLSLDETLAHTYETRREGSACTLTLRATSRQFPGLQIARHTRVRPGVREVEHWVTLTNLQSDGPHTVGGRLWVGGGEGLSLDPFGEMSRSFTPVDAAPDSAAGRGAAAIECDGMLPLMSETMVPQEPAHWRETWTAMQTLADGDHVAWFWRPDGVNKVKVDHGMLSSLECEPRTLAPGERAELVHVWYGFSYHSLPDVRNRWSQLVGHKTLPRDERYHVPTVPAIAARWVGETILVRGTRACRKLELAFATPFPLPGELRLVLPAGGQGVFLTPDGPQAALAMPDPVPGSPAQIEVELDVPDGAPSVAAVQLHFSGAFELDFDLPLLTTSAGEVAVERDVVEGQPAWVVSNGALSFAVLDGLSGSLVRLHDALGRSYLYDHAPDVKPWFFFENHVGGVQPMVAGRQIEMIFGELDALRAEPAADGRWKGVEVAWTALKEEHLRGQRFRLAYLTLPGSDVIRLRLRHHNPTPRRIEWFGALLANLALGDGPGGGAGEGMVVRAPGGRGTWTRNPAPKPFVNPGYLGEPWVHALKGEQSIALLKPRGFLGAVQVLDFPEFVVGMLYSLLQTGPQGENEIEFALALNPDAAAIRHLIEALGT